jgi:hypothetical protein
MAQSKYPYVNAGELPFLITKPNEAVSITRIQRVYVGEPSTVSILLDSGASFQISNIDFEGLLKMISNPFVVSRENLQRGKKPEEKIDDMLKAFKEKEGTKSEPNDSGDSKGPRNKGVTSK